MAALDMARLLLALALIVTLAGLLRLVAERIRQPPVLGDLVAGLALGPTLLGTVAPDVHRALFPTELRGPLDAFGWVGLVLFLFLAGAEMNLRWRDAQPVAWVAVGGLAMPLVLGLVLAYVRPSWFFEGAYGFEHYLLVATVLSVSALPILAALLTETGLLHTPFGAITMGAGTIDDILAWGVLAFVAGRANATFVQQPLASLGYVLALVALLLLVDRHLRAREPAESGGRLAFPVLLVATLLAAWLTASAGFHAFVGPLAVGAVVSRRPAARSFATEHLGALTRLLFLPALFFSFGADADLTLLAHVGVAAVVATTLAASAGKIGGAYVGGRAAGLTHEASLAAGILLNARGAVGLVVTKVGFDAGLLSREGYALLVVVIVFTTMAAPPLLRLFGRSSVPWGRRARRSDAP